MEKNLEKVFMEKNKEDETTNKRIGVPGSDGGWCCAAAGVIRASDLPKMM